MQILRSGKQTETGTDTITYCCTYIKEVLQRILIFRLSLKITSKGGYCKPHTHHINQFYAFVVLKVDKVATHNFLTKYCWQIMQRKSKLLASMA